MTECGRCGDCCRVVGLDSTQDHVRQRVAKRTARGGPGISRQERWVLDELAVISYEEALQRLPGLALQEQEAPGTVTGRELYRCKNFDETTDLCMVPDDKPPACSGFPWYGQEIPGAPHSMIAYPRCTFRADLWPADQEWLRGLKLLTIQAKPPE